MFFQAQTQKGTVKWFNSIKGYGFISQGSGDDLFVHMSDIANTNKSLIEGEQVSYTIGSSNRGKVAKNVTSI